MNKKKRFIFLTPRELEIEGATVQEIVEAMKRIDDSTLTQPNTFSRIMGRILSVEEPEKELKTDCA